jgi:hypothetical protein
MSALHDSDLRLDGNAAAGLLSEIFSVEATEALLACAHCGTEGAVGAVHVYARGPGTILRCPTCSAVLIRIARVRDGRLVADLRGVARLER